MASKSTAKANGKTTAKAKAKPAAKAGVETETKDAQSQAAPQEGSEQVATAPTRKLTTAEEVARRQSANAPVGLGSIPTTTQG